MAERDAFSNFTQAYQAAYNSQITQAQQTAQLILERRRQEQAEQQRRADNTFRQQQLGIQERDQSSLSALRQAQMKGLLDRNDRANKSFDLVEAMSPTIEQAKAIQTLTQEVRIGRLTRAQEEEGIATILAPQLRAMRLAAAGNFDAANKQMETLKLPITFGPDPKTKRVSMYNAGVPVAVVDFPRGLGPIPVDTPTESATPASPAIFRPDPPPSSTPPTSEGKKVDFIDYNLTTPSQDRAFLFGEGYDDPRSVLDTLPDAYYEALQSKFPGA